MNEFWVLLKSINEVKEFVSIVNTCEHEVDIISGRYIVDAKSIMGIFSLDLSKPIKVTVKNDGCEKMIDRLSDFVVKGYKQK